MKIFATYLFSKSFLRNLAYALGILLVFILFTMSCIRVYTHHGRSNAVPDFSGLELEDAIKRIESKDFRYAIFDSHYVADKGTGVILDQHPEPGFLVKKNRKIFLTINASSPGMIEMPNLVGISLREARIKLEGYGLQLGSLFYRYDISENVILDQQFNGKKINPGDSIVKGSKVDMVLGKGLANVRRQVPNLIGMSIDKAEVTATNATFNIGAIIKDNTLENVPDSITPFIYKQKPESHPGLKRPLGSTISLFITLDSTKVPGFVKEPLEELLLNDTNETDSISNTISSI